MFAEWYNAINKSGRSCVVNKEIIADIKNKLQGPMTTLELMAEKKANKKRVPIEFIEDALKDIDKAVELLDELSE